jgi:hypothetical protein
MRRKYLITAALTCISAAIPTAAAAQQSITFTSPPDTFSINSTAQATVSRQGPFLEVAIDRHTMWASKKYAGPHHVVSYSAAITSRNKEDRWATQRDSRSVAEAFTLNAGETKQLPPAKLLIPIDGIKNIHEHWIVLKVKVRAPQAEDGYGYTYAHSEKLKLVP